MTQEEKIEFYARMYNTIQEICRTARNNNIHLWVLENYLQNIDNFIWIWNLEDQKPIFTEEQKQKYMDLTDQIGDRIYFNF